MSQSKKADRQQRSAATKAFLGLLVGVGILYGVVLAYHVATPIPSDDGAEASWLEQCRQVCAQYGLVYTGDIKVDAEVYLDAVESKKLSSPLEELLNAPDFQRAETEQHPLIGKPAPDFTLINAEDQPVSLSTMRKQGPIVLVFYYGYNCSHCVAQLFALQKDLEYFHELGAEVVAISADKPEFTREQYTEYGGFIFPVLSDPDYAVSEAWGVYMRPSESQQEDLLHGTFVIDRSGTVVFANRGYQPFVDNQSLLQWISGTSSRREIE
ncbi:MAG: redoxin domain-containing protein [Planctomycetaceae bacterium]|nr:redoxin domain-containing protein [Planctomycetaceae bacterium]